MRLVSSIIALSMYVSATPLLAQGSSTVPFIGVGAGLQAIPAVYAENCGVSLLSQNASGGYGAEVRAGMPLWTALSLEAQLTVHVLPEQTCTLVGRGYSQGIHTERFRGSGYSRSLHGSDIRLRYEPYAPWVFTGGVGWLWNHGDPYVVGSMGWRWGRRLRAILDAEIRGHRISTELLTREWLNYEVIEVLSERTDHDWKMGIGFRLGLEVPIG